MSTLVESNNIGINGYGADINANIVENKIGDCLNQNIKKSKFKLFGQNNLMYDKGTTLIDTQQRLGPGRYELDNTYGCNCGLPEARDLQLSQPVINFSAGYGSIGEKGCLVENDSQLRFSGLTNKKYINQFRNMQNQGFFGKGSYAVDTESILRDSQITRVDRPCNVLSGSSTLPFSITPMIKKLENEVQDPKNIIPEDSMESWIRGGIPSRQIARNIDYLKRCNGKKQ